MNKAVNHHVGSRRTGRASRPGWLGMAFVPLLVSGALGCASTEIEPEQPEASAKEPTPAAATRTASDVPAVDPAVVARLTQMGMFLRDQKSFTVRADAATDEVLDSRQKIQLTTVADISVRRPDRLHAKVRSDRKEREFFYDGKTFTIYGPKVGYYAKVEAPPTIRGLVETVNERYGIELPFADLFYWGTEEDGLPALTNAVDLGKSKIDGVETSHYALRQADVDWQIWIESGERPLPRKLIITTTVDPEKPQHEVTYKWNLGVMLPDATFTFAPPATARKIPLEEVTGEATQPEP